MAAGDEMMETDEPPAVENEDRLSGCAVLPKILSFLGLKDVHSMLLVNRRCYNVVNRNWNFMQRWPSTLRINFDVKGFTIQYRVDGTQELKLKIERCHISSVNGVFPAFVKQFFNNGAHVQNVDAMSEHVEQSRNLAFESTMEVFLRRSALIKNLYVDATAMKDYPRGGECWALLESCLRRFYKPFRHFGNVHFYCPTFLPIHSQIVNALGDVFYTIHIDNPKLVEIDPNPVGVTVDGDVQVEDALLVLMQWCDGVRNIGFVEASPIPTTLPTLWTVLLGRIRRPDVDIININQANNFVKISRSTDNVQLVIGCDVDDESHHLCITFVDTSWYSAWKAKLSA